MITWMFQKKEDSWSGIICSVINAYDIKYPAMCKLIGDPHSFDGEDNRGLPLKATWLFSMWNGDKVQFQYDRDETSVRRLEHEGLKSVMRGPMNECNYLSIMGNTDSTIIIATLLKHLFPKAIFEGHNKIDDPHYAIRKIFEKKHI